MVSLLGGARAVPASGARPSERAMAAFVRGTIAYLERDAARAPALVADRIAVLHAALGDRAEALRWLAVAARERSTTLPVTLATDPDLDSLRADPPSAPCSRSSRFPNRLRRRASLLICKWVGGAAPAAHIGRGGRGDP